MFRSVSEMRYDAANKVFVCQLVIEDYLSHLDSSIYTVVF